MSSTIPKPGEIWKVDLGIAGKVRWFIVVSRFDPDAPRALSLAVPVTTRNRGSSYEVSLGGIRPFTEESFANVQGLTSLEWSDFSAFGGRIPDALLQHIRSALRFVLEL
jgi:mRNA interferase MazF